MKLMTRMKEITASLKKHAADYLPDTIDTGFPQTRGRSFPEKGLRHHARQSSKDAMLERNKMHVGYKDSSSAASFYLVPPEANLDDPRTDHLLGDYYDFSGNEIDK